MKNIIKIRHFGKSTLGYVMAQAFFNDIQFENFMDCVNVCDKRTEKTRALGIKPGMKFYFIKNSDRNCYDTIWCESQLKGYQNNSICARNIAEKFCEGKWHECTDCKHGINITGQFIVTKEYTAKFLRGTKKW